MEWVHENIGAFGGDNSKVTLMDTRLVASYTTPDTTTLMLYLVSWPDLGILIVY